MLDSIKNFVGFKIIHRLTLFRNAANRAKVSKEGGTAFLRSSSILRKAASWFGGVGVVT
jgi:hypothetical protein